MRWWDEISNWIISKWRCGVKSVDVVWIRGVGVCISLSVYVSVVRWNAEMSESILEVVAWLGYKHACGGGVVMRWLWDGAKVRGRCCVEIMCVVWSWGTMKGVKWMKWIEGGFSFNCVFIPNHEFSCVFYFLGQNIAWSNHLKHDFTWKEALSWDVSWGRETRERLVRDSAWEVSFLLGLEPTFVYSSLILDWVR